MRTHIDWLTFTMPMIYYGQENTDYANAIKAGFVDMFEAEVVENVFGGIWTKNERSRAPYTDSWHDAEGGISLYASPNLIHCCVEISGKGCERLITMGTLNRILSASGQRVTRIDIACDIETSTIPSEFVAQVTHERMRTSGYIKSDTGETCYVGSQKSERYARVYRYNPPHPRAHLLRIEHVFRKEYAKKVAAEIIGSSLENVAVAAGMAFGWGHVEWQTGESESADISLVFERGNSGNTVFWLVNSVAPAFKRLCDNGTIRDPKAFLEAYFIVDNKDA